jgi:capsid assembly protease
MTMNSDILAELVAQPWAMEPKALEAFLEKVRAGGPHAPATLTAAFMDDGPKRTGMRIDNGVARIPISGVLLKKVPVWLKWFGVEATAYSDIQADLDAALADGGVKEIVLAVDSPGGQVAGVYEAAEAIQAARGRGKPITAQVGDLCASAAYWLAAQAHRITAGQNAQVGSIGVYSVYVDSSKAAEDEGFKVHVVSSGPHKGAGIPGAPITAEQLGGFQAVVDGMAENFKAAVARGRVRSTRKDVDGWATGQVWLAAQASTMGLIDGITTPGKRNEGAAGVRPAADSKVQENEEETMADDPKAAQEAVATERKRAADIKAAFPRHLEFALAHIEKGSSLIEAKVAFNEVLEAEAKTARGAQAAAEQKLADVAKAPKPAQGADPVPLGGDPSSTTSKGFIAVAKENRFEHQKVCVARLNHKGQGEPDCCTMTSAMSRVSAEQKELHRTFVEATAPKVKARKEALGWK